MTLNLPSLAQNVIDSYLKMRVNNKVIVCPYFTNIENARAGLRVFLGKATAKEIVDEVKFIAQKKQIDLNEISEPELYKLMADHNLGIDCSGLAVYITQALYKEKKGINILKKIKIASPWLNPWRYLVSKLRPVENISVRVLAKDKNSLKVKNFSEILPGDLIIQDNLRHIYIITEIEKEKEQIKKITYIHAPRPKDKDYFGPGIKEQTIFLEKNNLEELAEKMNHEITIKRLNF